jgi:hypothetical protein
MEHIRRLAFISVARGCSFATLAIFTLMIGFITTPGTAFEAGGLGFLLMAVILFLKARNAGTVSHKKTEVWIMLEDGMRPPPQVAPAIIANVRREVLFLWSRYSAIISAGLLAVAFVMFLFDVGQVSDMAGYRRR